MQHPVQTMVIAPSPMVAKQRVGPIALVLMSALATLPGMTHADPRTPSALELMDWAEVAYGPYFPDRPATASQDPYVYRYHPSTRNYLGVAGNSVYVLGPVAGSDSIPLRVGSLADFACSVHPDSCAAPSGWPQRTVTVVVPFAAGSALDNLARILVGVLQAPLGQAVVVRNVTGAGGTLGADEVARAAADGYTLLFTDSVMATSPTLYRQLPHQPLRDFEFIGLGAEMPFVVSARKSLPLSGIEAFNSWLAANSGIWAHTGIASPTYLCALMMREAMGVNSDLVAYRGSAPALADLIAGSVDGMCNELSVEPQVENGNIQALAVTSAQRSPRPVFANVPTMAERAYTGFVLTNWYGLYAPRGTPSAVLDTLQGALRAALQDTTLRSRYAASGVMMVDDERLAPASHRRFVETETTRFAPLLIKNGQYAD
jgi:tripartite-type tricarboxylate transporter receptor subunit TctC